MFQTLREICSDNWKCLGQILGAYIDVRHTTAERGIFVDQSMKKHSSGLKARLEFAPAFSIDSDILIAGEALSAGDQKFGRKCINRMCETVTKKDVVVLFVTHQFRPFLQFCSLGIDLDRGKKLFGGPINDAVGVYDGLCGVEKED